MSLPVDWNRNNADVINAAREKGYIVAEVDYRRMRRIYAVIAPDDSIVSGTEGYTPDIAWDKFGVMHQPGRREF